ncbi:MAG: AAA family ATPase [Thermoguttaceae bacterium]|nr:AAA family ATPase [Thermoguttaceae bacterium]
MYTQYWKLQERPFDDCDTSKYFCATEAISAAILKLHYAIDHQQHGIVLCGPSGVGKTTLLGHLRQSLVSDTRLWIPILFPEMPVPELLAEIAERVAWASGMATSSDMVFTPTPEVRVSVRRIEQQLQENLHRGIQTVLVLEEAHRLSPPALETLRLLLNFGDNETHHGLFLILSGQPGLLPMLNRLPHVEERLCGRSLLPPFSMEETGQYVAHRLEIAGAVESPFDEEAVEVLHRVSGGIPRRINRIADMSLLLGFAEEVERLNAELVQSVADDATFSSTATQASTIPR